MNGFETKKLIQSFFQVQFFSVEFHFCTSFCGATVKLKLGVSKLLLNDAVH